MLTPQLPPSVVAALLAWIAHSRRDLPWRRRRDPYAVWISEIMLQQTQVVTAVPYFERWLVRFPDVAELAAAPLAEVLKAWEGLGYYARGRNLHRAAQQIMACHGGQVPGNKDALLALPGIGPYTAGAILSLAFGQCEPVLDGNVRRVLCRLCDIADDPKLPAVQRRLWSLAQELAAAAPDGMAGAFNEALMELGALICTPASPACRSCPVATLCLAHGRGVEALRPLKVSRSRTPHYDVTAAIVTDEAGSYLLIQRPPDGLLGGLWGFPGSAPGKCELESTELAPYAGCLEAALSERLGIQVTVGEALPVIRHAYTHFRITLHPFHCRLIRGVPQALDYADVRWVPPAGLDSYPFSVTDRKIVAELSK